MTVEEQLDQLLQLAREEERARAKGHKVGTYEAHFAHGRVEMRLELAREAFLQRVKRAERG